VGKEHEPFRQLQLHKFKKGDLRYVDIAKLIALMRTLYRGNPAEFARFYHNELWQLLTET